MIILMLFFNKILCYPIVVFTYVVTLQPDLETVEREPKVFVLQNLCEPYNARYVCIVIASFWFEYTKIIFILFNSFQNLYPRLKKNNSYEASSHPSLTSQPYIQHRRLFTKRLLIYFTCKTFTKVTWRALAYLILRPVMVWLQDWT